MENVLFISKKISSDSIKIFKFTPDILQCAFQISYRNSIIPLVALSLERSSLSSTIIWDIKLVSPWSQKRPLVPGLHLHV